jgi:hypothetical protein
MRPDRLLKPRIDYMMRKDVSENWAANTALRHPFITDLQFPLRQDPALEHPHKVVQETLVFD